MPGGYYAKGSEKISKKLQQVLSGLKKRGDNSIAVKLKQKTSDHLERLKQPQALDMLGAYLPFFFGPPASVLAYLPQGSLLIVQEPAEVKEKAEALLTDIKDFHSGLFAEGELLATGSDLLFSTEELFENTSLPLLTCALFQSGAELPGVQAHNQVNAKAAPVYHGQWDLLKKDCQAWQKEHYQTYLVAGSMEKGRRLVSFLQEQTGGVRSKKPPAKEGSGQNCFNLALLEGALEEGFVIESLKLAVLTENTIVPRTKKKKRYTEHRGLKISDYRELKVGDYVVHEHHGIGAYQGLHTLEVGGINKDYLLLKYRGTDKLYLPVEQIGLVQKYSGGEGLSPRLHSLGGTQWLRQKKRVSHQVEEMAKELLELYAARRLIKGHRFGPDQAWQQDFEAAFAFEETPDQLQAIYEVKADLEKEHPMDRLICGDVGYGKTEVAMRAAFKVVAEGKQVAVLVPTTILAQQHYRTFQERFKDYPMVINQLSRFVPPAAQKKVLSDLRAGKTDIVIGTHRLLSGDVNFNDLGLLVIDEEQRFGVKQKEKLKQLRLKVDTLSMTATPIPRTLHMSLAGARDLSIIETPPENRYPIQTYVAQYSDNLVREAVQRELGRQGQVFIVFNSIEKIDDFAGKISELFPDVKVAVGHGRMREKVLERVMTDFQEGLYSVLVSTTIIESGLDIPNVNTLIVYDADRFGLAQLYQIRGRVGRSDRLAYAWLTYRKNKIISEVARKRLKAVKDFTELGSGLKIALRDLEIRGAGNILGAEQHGFIAEVGYDLYVKLLNEAVAKLKNMQVEEKELPRLELKVDAYIPSSYIAAQDQKIDFYQRIYRAADEQELRDIKEELTDRYGAVPAPLVTLFAVASLKLFLGTLGVESVQQQGPALTVNFFAAASLKKKVPSLNGLPYAARIRVNTQLPLSFTLFAKNNSAFSFEQVSAVLKALEQAIKA